MAVPDGRVPGKNLGRCLRVQSIASLLLAGGLWMIGPVAVYSSIFGSLAAFIPALFFALVVAPKFGPDSVAFLRAAVLAEVAKLLLTALTCVAVFIWIKPLAASWFFAGMVVTILSGRLCLLYRA